MTDNDEIGLPNPRASTIPTLGARLVVATAVGLVVWVVVALRLRAAGVYAMGLDFTPHWWAADAMRRGYSPYKVINGFSRQYPFNGGYFWMLPTAVILYPFAYLPMQTAMPLFSGISAVVFTYALTQDGWWRLPFLASLSFLNGASSGQIVPLVTSAILIPSLGWVAPMNTRLAPLERRTTCLVGTFFSLAGWSRCRSRSGRGGRRSGMPTSMTWLADRTTTFQFS